MELSQLQYFQTVARLEHITQAANILHVSQPALSRAISRLEDEVGVKLFERDGNRIRLSPYGTAFLNRVDRAVTELSNGMEELHSMDGAEFGDVSFASFTSGLLSQPLLQYLLKHPNVHLNQKIQSPQQIEYSLETGEIDFGFSLYPVVSPKVCWTPIAEDELIILVSQQHPLAAKDSIELEELSNERFVITNSGFGMRELVDGFCVRAGFIPKVFYEGAEGDLVMSLLRENACVFILPASVHIWKIQSDRDVFSPLHGNQYRPPISALRIKNPSCRFSYGVSTLKNKSISRAARSFYDMLLDYFAGWSTLWDKIDLRNY
jgi:DNA-binding transcriptional LysR family regulator